MITSSFQRIINRNFQIIPEKYLYILLLHDVIIRLYTLFFTILLHDRKQYKSLISNIIFKLHSNKLDV